MSINLYIQICCFTDSVLTEQTPSPDVPTPRITTAAPPPTTTTAANAGNQGGAPTAPATAVRTPLRQKRDSAYKRLKLSEIKQSLGDRMKTKLRRRISSDQVLLLSD